MSNAVATTGILVKRKPAVVAILTSSVEAGALTIITTAVPHGFSTGDTAVIAGHTGSTPAVDGSRVVTRIDATHFSVLVDVSVAGSGGTVTSATSISSSSIANPTVITTGVAHGFVTGDVVTIAGHTGSTPSLNGDWTITVLSPTTFSIPIQVTVAGSGGTASQFDTIGEITKVTPAGFSRNKLETSTHNDGAESYNLGILRQSDAMLTINYLANEVTHQALLNDMLYNTMASWQVSFPSGIKQTGPARVQQFKIAEAPVDGVQSADIVFAWAGPVVQT